MVSRSLETVAAQRFLMEQLAIPLSQQAGKWLVIPQTAGCASNVSEAYPRNGNSKELWDE